MNADETLAKFAMPRGGGKAPDVSDDELENATPEKLKRYYEKSLSNEKRAKLFQAGSWRRLAERIRDLMDESEKPEPFTHND